MGNPIIIYLSIPLRTLQKLAKKCRRVLSLWMWKLCCRSANKFENAAANLSVPPDFGCYPLHYM